MSKPLVVGLIQKNRKDQVRVSLDTYQGHNLIDLRVVVPLADHTDVLAPTAKGVSLNVSHIPELRSLLADAEAQAREMGWLS